MSREVANWIRGSRRRAPDSMGNLYLFLRDELPPRIQRFIPEWIELEDVLGETVLAVLKHLGNLRTSSGRLGMQWRIRGRESLLRFAVAKAGAMVRRLKREASRRCGLAAAEGIPCRDSNPEDPHGDRLSAWLSIIKVNLGPAEWRLFKVHWLSGLGGAELATRSGLSGNALACRLYRLKLKVRDILARLEACQQSQ